MRLRLLTVNAWALPWPVSRDAPARLAALGKRLPDFDADVAAFQEVWTSSAREALVDAGHSAGYRAVWHSMAHGGGSGLLVLSRLPIREAHFTPFRLNGLPERVQHGDYYGRKGFVRLSLETQSGPVSLINTHLHARYGGGENRLDYIGHRAAQLIELSAGLAGVHDPVAALGDFNLNEGSPGYRLLVGLSGLRDAAAALDARESTTLSTNPYRGGGTRLGDRVDYVFTRDGRTTAARPRSIQRVLDEHFEIDGRPGSYSDHAGLLAEVEIGGAPSPVAAPSPEALALGADLLAVGREKANLRRAEQRLWAGTGAAACLTAFAQAQRLALPRRRLLKASLCALPVLGLGWSAGLAALTETFVPEELRGYDAVGQILGELATRERLG